MSAAPSQNTAYASSSCASSTAAISIPSGGSEAGRPGSRSRASETTRSMTTKPRRCAKPTDGSSSSRTHPSALAASERHGHGRGRDREACRRAPSRAIRGRRRPRPAGRRTATSGRRSRSRPREARPPPAGTAARARGRRARGRSRRRWDPRARRLPSTPHRPRGRHRSRRGGSSRPLQEAVALGVDLAAVEDANPSGIDTDTDDEQRPDVAPEVAHAGAVEDRLPDARRARRSPARSSRSPASSRAER